MDIALFIDQYGEADIDIEDNDVVIDNGLETAVYISLFTNCRDDDNIGNKQGWWGDYFLDKPLGSKLWLLTRENATEEVLDSFRAYAQDALKWMVDDGIAESIDVNVSLDTNNFLLVDITISRPSNVNEKYQYYFNWKSQELKPIMTGAPGSALLGAI